MHYSIIIPIHNEEQYLPILLEELKVFSTQNEILIINDGSSDNSKSILEKAIHIRLLNLKKNSGKGLAIKTGLSIAKYDKIIIFDGDLEINTSNIKDLMVLNKSKNTNFVIGYRYDDNFFFDSFWDLGNFILTAIFNYINNSKLKDALCCAKSFYKSDIKIELINSKSFDIDVELTAALIKRDLEFKTTFLNYNRRSIREGKKLRFLDAWIIFKRILIS